MSKKATALLFALALFIGSYTFATAQHQPVNPEVLPTAPTWMMDGSSSLTMGCTYSECMRHCQRFGEDPWSVCHETCNRDCGNQQ